MRRLRWAGVVFLLGVACGTTQIFEVQPAPAGTDGGTTGTDGGKAHPSASDDDDDTTPGDDDDDDVVPKDGGTDAAKTVCDGPCPPEVLASNLSQATALTVDKQNIYFAIEGSATGNVYQCPKTGCAGAPIALGPGYAYGIGVIGGNAIWGDYFTGKLWSCAVGGCNDDPTPIATNETQIRGVWSDGAKVYWSSSLDNGSLRACDPASCTPTSVVKDIGVGVQILAVEAGTIAWISGAKARACPIGDCTTPKVLGDASHGLTLVGAKAYWMTSAHTIVSCGSTSECASPLLIGSTQSPEALTTDGNDVYWRDELYQAIYRCPATGCGVSPDTLATKQPGQPGGQLRLDGNYLYWTSTSHVLRVPK